MLVDLSDDRYRVWWRYHRGGARLVVECTIEGSVDCGAVDRGYYSPRAPLVRERWRIESLRRALARGGFTRPERTLFWRAYFYRVPARPGPLEQARWDGYAMGYADGYAKINPIKVNPIPERSR